MDQKKISLENIRGAIIQQIVPLMDDESLDSRDRFAIISHLAQSQGDPRYFEQAVRLVPALDKSEQLSAYMALLEDVESELLDMDEFGQDQTDTTDAPAALDAHTQANETAEVIATPAE